MNALSINNAISFPTNIQCFDLSEESKDILQKLKNIKPSYFFSQDTILQNKLKTINPAELTTILHRIFTDMVQDDTFRDPIKFLDQLSTLIPIETLQEAVKNDIGNALEEAKSMFQEAKIYLAANHHPSPPIHAYLSTILDGLCSLLEGFITAFGIGDFFSPPLNQNDAQMKTFKLMTLMSLTQSIASMVPFLGAAIAGIVIGGFFFSIAALSLIWPMIKPITTYLPANAENWTKELQSNSSVVEGRKESLNDIANILKMDRHAILVGPSRVGKGITAKAFAQAVVNGEYPWLKGKTVFHINTTELLTSANIFADETVLQKVCKTIGRHAKDIILVLDEIHMACKNNEKIADQLKTMLDEGGVFAHVIGITTSEEYEKYVKENQAFALRFDRVDIENTNRDETLKILSNTVLENSSKLVVDKDAIQYIYEQSQKNPNAPQPITSKNILKRCIGQTGKTQKSLTEKKLIELANRKSSLLFQAAANYERTKQMRIEIMEIEKEELILREIQKKEIKEIDQLFKMKDLLGDVTEETYRTVLKVSTVAQEKLNGKDKKQLTRFLLLNNFVRHTLLDYINTKSKALGVTLVVNKALVDTIQIQK